MPKRVTKVKKSQAAQMAASAATQPIDAKSVELLLAYAQGGYVHLNRGNCPDTVQGFAARDPDCVVCQAVDAVSASLSPQIA